MNGFYKFKFENIVSILRSRLTLMFILAIAGLPAFAQVKFTTIASSKEVGRGEYVQVEFVVENAEQIEHLEHPTFQDFNIVQGPIQSSGMSIVNGSMSQYKALSFVLQPVKTGKFTIQGATATINGKLMHSNTVTIEVTANGSSNNSNNSVQPAVPQPAWPPAWPGEQADVDREYYLKPGENIVDKIKKNLFVKVDVSKKSCYVGEPIVATYKLYSRVQSESRVVKHPSLNGFSVYDMMDPNRDDASVENVNGKPFTVHIIRKTQLIPLQAGTVDLDPVEVENTVHFLKTTGREKRSSGNSAQDLFDDLFNDNIQGVPIEQEITLDSKPVAIDVKPLPDENKPADFNGAVGHFTVQANVENKNLTAQDAATLKVTVKGSGNLSVVNAPAIKWPSDIENYDANTKENIDKTVAPLSGTKTFEYNFIPKQAGDYIIPAIQLSYFDPASNSYKTATAQSLNFTVKAAKVNKPSHVAEVSGQPAEDTTNGALDFLQDHLEWFFAIIILSGLAAYLWWQNKKLRKIHEAEKLAAAERARQEAIAKAELEKVPVRVDHLLLPRQLLEHGDFNGFYRELNRSIWHAVADKINLPASELNKYNITQELRAQGWDEETTALLKDILNECEIKLYTPDYNTQNMQQLLQQAESLINKLA